MRFKILSQGCAFSRPATRSVHATFHSVRVDTWAGWAINHHLTLISNEWPKLRLLPFNWSVLCFKKQLSLKCPKTRTGLTFQLFFWLKIENSLKSHATWTDCESVRRGQAYLVRPSGLNFPRRVVCVTAIFGQGKELFYDWGVTLKSEMDSFTSFPALIFTIAKKRLYSRGRMLPQED